MQHRAYGLGYQQSDQGFEHEQHAVLAAVDQGSRIRGCGGPFATGAVPATSLTECPTLEGEGRRATCPHGMRRDTTCDVRVEAAPKLQRIAN